MSWRRGRSRYLLKLAGIMGWVVSVSLTTASEPIEDHTNVFNAQEMRIVTREDILTPDITPRRPSLIAHEKNIEQVKRRLGWRGVWSVSRNALQNTATILDYTHIALSSLANLGNLEQRLRQPLHGILIAMVIAKMVHERFSLVAERRISEYNLSVAQLIQDHRYFQGELNNIRFQHTARILAERGQRLSYEGLPLSYQENYEGLQTTEEMIESLKEKTSCEKKCYECESFFWTNTSVIYEIGEFICAFAELALLSASMLMGEEHKAYATVTICAVAVNVLCVYLGNLKNYAERVSQERAHAMVALEDVFEERELI